MKRITLLTGLLAGAMALQAAPREPQQMTATLQKDAVVVTNGKARFTFRADFRLFRTDKDPKMELRTLPDCRFFAPSWIADNLAPEKTIAQIKQSKSMGGDGIDDSVSGSVKGRTFDLFAAAPFTDLTPSKAEMAGDTIRFSYPRHGVGNTRMPRMGHRRIGAGHGVPIHPGTRRLLLGRIPRSPGLRPEPGRCAVAADGLAAANLPFAVLHVAGFHLPDSRHARPCRRCHGRRCGRQSGDALPTPAYARQQPLRRGPAQPRRQGPADAPSPRCWDTPVRRWSPAKPSPSACGCGSRKNR